MPEIPAIGELHGLIALTLLQKRTLLTGEEVRFLRKSAGLSQVQLARLMGVDQTRPSKWEKLGVTRETDRFLRSLILSGLQQKLSPSPPKEVVCALAARHARQLYVGDVLNNVREKKSGPSKVVFRVDPTSTGQPWLLTSPVIASTQLNM